MDQKRNRNHGENDHYRCYPAKKRADQETAFEKTGSSINKKVLRRLSFHLSAGDQKKHFRTF